MRLHHPDTDPQRGLTLVELLVVVLILLVLLAIAIPGFLGLRRRADDRAAQSNLRNAYVAARTIFAGTQDYREAGPVTLEGLVPELGYVPEGVQSVDLDVISVDATSDRRWVGAALSRSGRCFAIRDDLTDGTTYAVSVSGDCRAGAAWAASASAPDWTSATG